MQPHFFLSGIVDKPLKYYMNWWCAMGRICPMTMVQNSPIYGQSLIQGSKTEFRWKCG
jgi:hypothetical protein